MQTAPPHAILEALRAKLARLETGHPPPAGRPVLSFGIPAIDHALPGGGLASGALHEIAGAGAQAEHATTAALLAATLLAGARGMVLWVLERRDLFAPALAAVGLTPDRVVYAEAGKPAAVLLVMEEGLRHPGPGRRGRRTRRAPDPDRVAPPATGGRTVGGNRLRAPPQPALRRPGAG